MFQWIAITQFDLNRFQIDFFHLYSFIENIFTKWNIPTKRNAQSSRLLDPLDLVFKNPLLTSLLFGTGEHIYLCSFKNQYCENFVFRNYISPDNSKNTNPWYVLLTRTDHFDSKSSKIFSLKKTFTYVLRTRHFQYFRKSLRKLESKCCILKGL